MAALLAVPPRTPSPEVRIRSQSFSFESPSSLTRLNATTPIEDYPFSKSTGTINTTKAVPQHHVLLPLRTKMSEESLSDTSSAMSISTASSPTTSSHRTSLQELPEGNLLGLFENAHAPMPADALTSHPPRPLSSLCGTQSPAKRPRFSPPGLQLPPSVVVGAVDVGPASPFAFQDPSSAMTSPWLVRVVLDLHDVHRLCWMDISDVVWRMHGVQTCSGEVLDILSGNGRVRRSWWE